MRCGENVGKENRKTLVESTLRGFPVPGAGDESLCLKKIMKLEYMYINY